MNRYFTDQELEEMGRRTLDVLDESIEAGDTERARYLAKRMYREFSAMHDLYLDWTAGLMDRIYRSGGQDALYAALKEVLAQSNPPETGKPRNFRERVRDLAFVLRGHLVGLHLKEDAEKVSMTMKPCGSGQRLMEKGAYGPPVNLSMIDEPHPMTWDKRGFPIYCTHAPVLETLSMEIRGYPEVVAHPASEMAKESCSYSIYKKVEDIPEEVYKRLGKRKPGQ